MLNGLMVSLNHFAVTCSNDNSFFAFPTWYKYLKAGAAGGGPCSIMFKFPDDIPLVALAMLDIVLRLAGIVAVFFVVIGAVSYVTSQGDSNAVAKARGTILNALIGLLIATFSIAIVSFIGAKVG